MLSQVVVDYPPPVLFAQIAAKHMKDRAAARIGIGVENGIGVGVVSCHNRTSIALVPGAEICGLVSSDILVEEVVAAELVFIPHRLKVNGKTLLITIYQPMSDRLDSHQTTGAPVHEIAGRRWSGRVPCVHHESCCPSEWWH